MSDDPWKVGTVIRQGHPLWAWTEARKVMAERLTEGLGEGSAHLAQDWADALLARLAQHDPPLLICTPDEMKEEAT